MFLTSNVQLTAHNTDPKLLNPTDLLVIRKYIWVTILGSNLVSKYNKKGQLINSITVQQPTAICLAKRKPYHGSSSDDSSKCHNDIIYVGTMSGVVYTISGGIATSYITSTGAISGIAYLKGSLYLATYTSGSVYVYKDKTATHTIMDKPLADVGYMPYGIREINNKIYITYTNKVKQAGDGYVDVYTPKCGLKRLINRGPLNIPYGLSFSQNKLLVSSFGNGQTSVYDHDEHRSVEYLMPLENNSGGAYVYDGIMGTFVDNDKLYFVCNSDSGKIGALGVLSLN
jgi:hypothetical protein